MNNFERVMSGFGLAIGLLPAGMAVANSTVEIVRNIRAVQEVSKIGASANEAEKIASTAATAEKVVLEGEKQGYKTATDSSQHAWVNESGQIKWPELYRGFQNFPEKEIIAPGKFLDRFGDASGTFVSPKGVPFEARSLPQSYLTEKPYNVYEVIKPIEVDSGLSAPWFDQPGLGRQYELPETVASLLEKGYIRQVLQ